MTTVAIARLSTVVPVVCRCVKVLVTREVFFANSPIGPLPEPTEMQVDSCGIEGTSKGSRWTFRPTRAYVGALTFPDKVGGPVFSFCQRRQVNLPRGDCGRFPVDSEHASVSNQDSLVSQGKRPCSGREKSKVRCAQPR